MITTRADGRPQASPVSCGVDDAGRIVVATYPERAKTRNARRDPDRVSVLFLSDDFGGAWVQVDGTAEVLDIPDAVEPLVDYFRSISGEHPNWDEYRQAMIDQGKSAAPRHPHALGPDRHRRLPRPPGDGIKAVNSKSLCRTDRCSALTRPPTGVAGWSTRSTRGASPTRTATASGTCAACSAAWTTWNAWAWTWSGCRRSTGRRWTTTATTSATTRTSTRCSARWPTWTS